MGSSTSRRERILVETDFLFGINPLDKLHDYVINIVRLSKNGAIDCFIPTSALMEFRAVLYSRGKEPSEVLEALSIVREFLRSSNIGEIPLKSEHIISGETLRMRYRELTYFDAIHAGVALIENMTIVSYDEIYSRLEEIKWRKITEFQK